MRKTITTYALYFGLWMLSLCSVPAQTFEVLPYLENGNTDRRINFIYLSEGYTAEQLDQFVADASAIIEAQFNYTPYKEYKNFFNLYLVKVPSAESGTDHPQNTGDSGCTDVPVMQNDTFFDSTFDAYGIHRLLVPDIDKVNEVLIQNTPFFDQGFVIVNTPYYGGSGGDFATGSLHEAAVAIITHESGHSFAMLRDEYWAGISFAAEAPNMTQESDPESVRWKNWLGDAGIGIYPYGDNPPQSEWFRPHQACLMRQLDQSFCAVCVEAFIDRIYLLVSPIDSFLPDNPSVDYNGEDELTFQVNLIHPDPDTLHLKWYLDGVLTAENTDTLTLTNDDLGTDNHQVVCEVTDETGLSRTHVFADGYVFTQTWDINNYSSVEEAGNAKFIYKAYPNPVHRNLYFEYMADHRSPVVLSFYNLTGQLVMSRELPPGSGVFRYQYDISGWKPGVYFMEIRKNTYTKTHVFIKE